MHCFLSFFVEKNLVQNFVLPPRRFNTAHVLCTFWYSNYRRVVWYHDGRNPSATVPRRVSALHYGVIAWWYIITVLVASNWVGLTVLLVATGYDPRYCDSLHVSRTITYVNKTRRWVPQCTQYMFCVKSTQRNTKILDQVFFDKKAQERRRDTSGCKIFSSIYELYTEFRIMN